MNNPVGGRSCRFRFPLGIGDRGGVGYFIVYSRWVEGILVCGIWYIRIRSGIEYVYGM
jgi:hypothetical protein